MKRFLALLLLMVAPAAQGADNIVILLDNSLSMEEGMRSVRVRKFSAAQEALIGVLDQIPQNANVGILTFKGWLYPEGQQGLAPVDKTKIAKAIRASAPDPLVGTPLGTYIKEAADALLVKRKEDKGYGTYKLLVVTDGEATPDSEGELLNKLVPDILSRGIVLDSIGVDMQSDHTLSRNSHTYMKADNPESLKQAVSASLGEVNTTDSGVGNDDFAMIAAIPDEMASGIITTLADKSTMNWPIGTEKPVPATAGEDAVSPEVQVQEVASEDTSGFAILGIVVLVIFGIVVIIGIFRGLFGGY